jgi:hypothetical protein
MIGTSQKAVLSLFLFVASVSCYAIDGRIIKTIDYSIEEKWNYTLNQTEPDITNCDTVYKNQNLFITVLDSDFVLTSQNGSNVLYSLKIFKPDGTIYLSQDTLQLVYLKKKVNNGHPLSNVILKMHFKEDDSFGEYKFVLTITDNVSKKTKCINSKVVLAVLPSISQSPVIKDIDVFTKWMEFYYENPNPVKAISYYLFYTHSELSENETTLLPALSFFTEIVRNNAFLLPQILKSFEIQDIKSRIYLIYLLRCSNSVTDDFIDRLASHEKEIFLKAKDVPLTDMDGTVTDPFQLDMLWSTFFAGGSYQPILKLIKALEYSTFQKELEKSTTEAEEDQNVMKNVIYNIVKWSLKNNCKKHALVKDYCEWSLQFESLSGLQKVELSNILKD